LLSTVVERIEKTLGLGMKLISTGDASYEAKRKWSDTIKEQPCHSSKLTKTRKQQIR
jgi:hypothetical protein